MKITRPNLFAALLITAIVVESCGSQNKAALRSSGGKFRSSSCPAYGGGNGSGSGVGTNVGGVNPGYGYTNPGTFNLTNNTAGFETKNDVYVPSGMAGVLTGGETNDLGKWEVWSDMVKTALDEQIKIWKMHPYNRYAVLLQTEDGMPVHGATVSLLNSQKQIIWEAVTDNTGAAQLWSGMFNIAAADVTVSEISIEYRGIKEKIENPVDFFKGINTKKLSTPYVKSDNVDIAFVVDATGSMGDEIDFLKEELNDIINKTQSKYDKLNLRLGSVFYRCIGNTYTTRMISLTTEFSGVMDFIKEQKADEGGTEAVEVALDDAINKLKWRNDARARIIFMVLDEPSGYSNEVIEKLHAKMQEAAKKGIKIIPVVASGSGNADEHDRNLEYLMRTIALATNGNYIFITDHSGVGGKHTEPIIDNYEVEKLNDIITRTIENNIYMPEKVKPEDPEVTPDTLLVSNETSVLNDALEKLDETTSDSALLASLLPYTDYSSVDDLNKHRPIEKMDTTAFLNDQKLEVHTLKIYPNPSNGMIKAEYNTTVDFLYLADLSGKILNRISTNGNSSINVDLNEYPNGIYIVQYPDGGKWISAKIVLQK